MKKLYMYLHRYPHIQSIHPYNNRHVHMDLHIPRQCMYPLEKQVTVFLAKSQSQLFSHRYNLQSPKSHVWGCVNYNVLMTAYKCPQVTAQRCCKAKQATLLGYYGSGVGSDIVSPSYDRTTETVQGCGLHVQRCSIAVYVQNI